MTAIALVLVLLLVCASLWWNDGPASPLRAALVLVLALLLIAALMRWPIVGDLGRALWITP